MMLRQGWKEKLVFPGDQRGRFNLDEAAKEIDIDPDLAKAMYKPIQYTFNIKSQRYPSESSRSSRPGAESCKRRIMFPLYEKNKRIDKQLQASRHTFSTF